MKDHKHYNTAYRAYYNTSFHPDERAVQAISDFESDIATLKEHGIDERALIKYETLWINAMVAKSRCLSPMITGPANFPVARNERANRAERKATDACVAFYRKLIDKAEKEAFYRDNPSARPVMSDAVDAIDSLNALLKEAEDWQDLMKAVNKAVSKGNKGAVVDLLGEEEAEKILDLKKFGGPGYASFELTNNRAKITRIKKRISEIEKRKATNPKTIVIGTTTITENLDLMRLQLFFDGKPAPEVIKALKANGFRWAPTHKAWQRQLTNNAVFAFNHYILPILKA